MPNRRDLLLERIDEAQGIDLAVLAFDDGAARHDGRLRANLERSGTPIGDADERIAATAMTHGLSVVPRNVRNFERLPAMTTEDWPDDPG